MVLDFGLVQIQDASGQTLSANSSSGLMVGSFDYMSPEQSTSEIELDERSDIYSLGTLCFIRCSLGKRYANVRQSY